MTPAVAATRAALVAALAPIPDWSAWPSAPDATALPAVWVEQPAAVRSETARTMTTGIWSVVAAVDPTSTDDVTTQLDAMVDVVAEAVGGSHQPVFRLNGWVREQRPVGATTAECVVVQFETDHLNTC